jgi:hypothetical protein
MSWPIFAAIRENSDFAASFGSTLEDIDETAAWNSAVRSTAMFVPDNKVENVEGQSINQ